jgi:hypothetical protein
MRNPLRRPPDRIIGGASDPYLRRWFIIPRNRWFNIYLHQFLRSDDDRALHDHPWVNLSILLTGRYMEHDVDGNVTLRKPWRPWAPWRLVFRLATTFHRIEMLTTTSEPQGWTGYTVTHELPVWTLFLTGPNVREWGFLCPQGWRHWREFTNPANSGEIGRGCDE